MGDPTSGVVVESVGVLGFRNLAAGEIPLAPGINLVHGPNGAGKTNLLEATYTGLAGRSCRTRDERQLIAFGEPLARAEVRLREGRRRLEFLCAVSRAEGRRHLVDGSPAGPSAAELRPPLAVFMPDRLALVKGPPSLRRGHLDAFAAALWPARAEVRRRYGGTLSQRNALLGAIRAGTADETSLDAWDHELATAGVELIALRAEAAGALARPFAEAASALGVEAAATLAYRPRSDAGSGAELEAELAERRDSDLSRGYSGFGPHLDEVAFELGGRALRRYGSQGQQRLALLALLFAERAALIAAGRPAPLMLLDDVTSELDAARRELLVDRLAAGEGQSLITATEADQLPRSAPRMEIAVRDGRALVAASDRRDAAA
jgi:DNA replication and repair protein RecF